MRNSIIVYKEDGVDKITIVTGSTPIETLHSSSIYRQYGEELRDRVRDLCSVTDKTLGYHLSTMPKFYSKITEARIVSGERWERKLMESMEKNVPESGTINYRDGADHKK